MRCPSNYGKGVEHFFTTMLNADLTSYYKQSQLFPLVHILGYMDVTNNGGEDANKNKKISEKPPVETNEHQVTKI